MSEVNEEFVCSVKKENNLGCYRLHTIWKNDSFRINVATKDASWSGEMTPENIKRMSSQLQLDNKTYLNNCKDALTTNDGKPGISYMVENGSFVWKKLVDEDAGIQVKMGAVPVQPSNFVETIQKIVDIALNTNKNLQKEINNLNEEKDKLTKNNDKLFTALDEAKKCKIKMENDLYEKFIELLNSKKKKILDLENKLENKGGIQSVGAKPKVSKISKPPPPKKKKTTNKNPVSDKDAYEVETENDSDDDVAPVKSQRRSARISAKNSQSNDGSQEIVTRKRTSAAIEFSEPKNDKSDVEIEIDSDSTISDEDLYNLAKSVNEERTGEKIQEVLPEKTKENSSQKTKEGTPQKLGGKYNSVPPDTEDLLREIWG